MVLSTIFSERASILSLSPFHSLGPSSMGNCLSAESGRGRTKPNSNPQHQQQSPLQSPPQSPFQRQPQAQPVQSWNDQQPPSLEIGKKWSNLLSTAKVFVILSILWYSRLLTQIQHDFCVLATTILQVHPVIWVLNAARVSNIFVSTSMWQLTFTQS